MEATTPSGLAAVRALVDRRQDVVWSRSVTADEKNALADMLTTC
jgi:hypothetical protein